MCISVLVFVCLYACMCINTYICMWVYPYIKQFNEKQDKLVEEKSIDGY